MYDFGHVLTVESGGLYCSCCQSSETYNGLAELDYGNLRLGAWQRHNAAQALQRVEELVEAQGGACSHLRKGKGYTMPPGKRSKSPRLND